MWQDDLETLDGNGWDDEREVEVSFMGTVRPADRDEEGRVTEVSVKPWGRFEEPESIRVDPDSDGQDLVHNLYATVTVSGYVRTDEYGRKTIYVTDYDLEEDEMPVVVFQRRREMRRKKTTPDPEQQGGGHEEITRRRGALGAAGADRRGGRQVV